MCAIPTGVPGPRTPRRPRPTENLSGKPRVGSPRLWICPPWACPALRGRALLRPPDSVRPGETVYGAWDMCCWGLPTLFAADQQWAALGTCALMACRLSWQQGARCSAVWSRAVVACRQGWLPSLGGKTNAWGRDSALSPQSRFAWLPIAWLPSSPYHGDAGVGDWLRTTYSVSNEKVLM